MSFDQNTLPRMIEAATELVLGLNEMGVSFVEEACTVEERSALRGQLQFLDTAETLPRDFGSHTPGADARLIDSGLSTTNYDMEVYDLGYRFTEEEQEDFGQFGDAVDEHMPILVSNVEAAITADAAALLNAEANTAGVANGAWDTPTSTPQEDIVVGIRTNVPGAKLCIVGNNTADDLKLHSDFKAGVSFYADRSLLGDGDTDAALKQVLRDKFGFETVVIARQKLNTANEGQAATLGFHFGDFFWVGNKPAFIWVKQKNTDSMPRFTNNVRGGNALEMYYKRVGDVIRPSAANGLRFINIGT